MMTLPASSLTRILENDLVRSQCFLGGSIQHTSAVKHCIVRRRLQEDKQRNRSRAKRRRTATANDSEEREQPAVAAPAFVHLVDSPQSAIRTADPYAT